MPHVLVLLQVHDSLHSCVFFFPTKLPLFLFKVNLTKGCVSLLFIGTWSGNWKVEVESGSGKWKVESGSPIGKWNFFWKVELFLESGTFLESGSILEVDSLCSPFDITGAHATFLWLKWEAITSANPR